MGQVSREFALTRMFACTCSAKGIPYAAALGEADPQLVHDCRKDERNAILSGDKDFSPQGCAQIIAFTRQVSATHAAGVPRCRCPMHEGAGVWRQIQRQSSHELLLRSFCDLLVLISPACACRDAIRVVSPDRLWERGGAFYGLHPDTVLQIFCCGGRTDFHVSDCQQRMCMTACALWT